MVCEKTIKEKVYLQNFYEWIRVRKEVSESNNVDTFKSLHEKHKLFSRKYDVFHGYITKVAGLSLNY